MPSQEDETYFKGTSHVNNNGYALRVLHVVPHSPARTAGLEPWFDYIVKINSHELPMKYPIGSTPNYGINEDGSIGYGSKNADPRLAEVDYDSLIRELATVANEKRAVSLEVWNAKGGVLRTVSVPMGPYSYTPQKLDLEKFHERFQQLGLTVQSQNVNTATYVWRVLNTHPNSPAFQALLIPYSDYVIGCDSAFSDANGKGLLTKGGEALFSKTVLNYYNHHYASLGEDNIPITLYVYNHDYDILRPVTVNLSTSWATGNRGILGCDVGYGLLHRLPEVVGKFDNLLEKVDDVLFENKSDYSYKLDEKKAEPQAKQSPPLTSSLMGMTAFVPEEFLLAPATEPARTPALSGPPRPSISTGISASTIPGVQASNGVPTSKYAPVSEILSTNRPIPNRTATSGSNSVNATGPIPSVPAVDGNLGGPIHSIQTEQSPSASTGPTNITPSGPPQNLSSSGITLQVPSLSQTALELLPSTLGSTIVPPIVGSQIGVPPSIAPPKTHRKKKQHAANGVSSLTDFMNEELTRSKNNDVKYPGDDAGTPPPPPPTRSGR